MIKRKCDSVDDNQNEQLRKYKKKGKKVLDDNLDDEQKEHLKIEDNKRKKAKRDSLNVDEGTVEENEKKGKLCMITLMMNKKNI